MNIYVVRAGQTYGPYTEEVVRKYISEGSILSTDMGRTDTMPTLVPLSQLLAREAPSQPAYPPPAQPYQAPQSQATPHPPESKPDYGFSSAAAPAASVFGSAGAAAAGAGMSKKQYLEAIRHDSAYPTYRGFIGIIALIGFLIAGLVALAAVGTGIASMRQSSFGGFAIIVGGLLYAALIFLMARFFKEAALILADIGDSTVEANARHRAGH